MKPDLAAQLRALASRVRANLPRRSDPEQFHVEKDDIAKALLTIANAIEGRSDRSYESYANARRVVVTTQSEVIGGKRVTVQRRRLPFAISSG